MERIAAAWDTNPPAVDSSLEEIFLRLAEGASAGGQSALRRLRILRASILRWGQFNAHCREMNAEILTEGEP